MYESKHNAYTHFFSRNQDVPRSALLFFIVGVVDHASLYCFRSEFSSLIFPLLFFHLYLFH